MDEAGQSPHKVLVTRGRTFSEELGGKETFENVFYFDFSLPVFGNQKPLVSSRRRGCQRPREAPSPRMLFPRMGSCSGAGRAADHAHRTHEGSTHDGTVTCSREPLRGTWAPSRHRRPVPRAQNAITVPRLRCRGRPGDSVPWEGPAVGGRSPAGHPETGETALPGGDPSTPELVRARAETRGRVDVVTFLQNAERAKGCFCCKPMGLLGVNSLYI